MDLREREGGVGLPSFFVFLHFYGVFFMLMGKNDYLCG